MKRFAVHILVFLLGAASWQSWMSYHQRTDRAIYLPGGKVMEQSNQNYYRTLSAAFGGNVFDQADSGRGLTLPNGYKLDPPAPWQPVSETPLERELADIRSRLDKLEEKATPPK